jgi:hypothetical protein
MEDIMKTKAMLVTAAAAAIGLAFLSSGAIAQMSDAAYCEALSTQFRTLAGQGENSQAADAMAQCKAGNTAAGIPTLEKLLKEAKVTLPKR